MPSYFVDRQAHAGGEHLVHDRSRCPPDLFPAERQAEYLGDLLDGEQALLLASLKFPRVLGCHCCTLDDRVPHEPWLVPRGAAGPSVAA